MPRTFQLIGIDHLQFEPLFGLTDAQLKDLGAARCIATASPGFPCRISLEDARVGEQLLLLPYLHQPAASPYRASGPVYVRSGVRRRSLPAGTVSSYVTSRLMSVRAYDAAHMMVGASVCEGTVVAQAIDAHFGRDDVAYIHLHNAMRGCFSCQVVRASPAAG